MNDVLIQPQSENDLQPTGESVQESLSTEPPGNGHKPASLCQSVVVRNKLGLHFRPAAAFAGLARQFASTITVRNQDRVANGKNMMDMLTLIATEGTELTLEVAGPDAEEAMTRLSTVLGSVDMDDPDTIIALQR